MAVRVTPQSPLISTIGFLGSPRPSTFENPPTQRIAADESPTTRFI